MQVLWRAWKKRTRSSAQEVDQKIYEGATQIWVIIGLSADLIEKTQGSGRKFDEINIKIQRKRGCA